MIDLLHMTVTHGDVGHVKEALRNLMLMDGDVLGGEERSAVLLTLFERTNLFAANGVLFEQALWRGNTEILTCLTVHFIEHFSLCQWECPHTCADIEDDDDDYFEDDDDLTRPIPPTSYSQMRRNFNNALFNWRTAAGNSAVKPIVDAFREYFAGEAGPLVDMFQIFSQMCAAPNV